MDVASILPYLQQRGLLLNQLVYSGASVSVYKGQWQNCVAAIKILALEPIDDYTRMERECNSMIRLQHPNIVKMYDCFWCSNGLRYYLVIVVEWCNKDVMKDIHERRNAQFPWAEDKLWLAIRGMVSVFAYMQREGFAHRDIQPQNLFIVSENLIKIGDFGSGRFTECHQNFAKMTLVGTPFFLSPLLRQNLMGNRGGTIHDAFKSDVYSLGLTLLLMTSQHDQNALATAIMQPASLWSVIQAIPYSDSLKSMLGWMLQYDESDRCDFLQLNEWLDLSTDPDHIQMQVIANAAPTTVCMLCSNLISSPQHVVTLACNPTHQFCSKDCFDTFVRKHSKACPKCCSPISASFPRPRTEPLFDLQESTMASQPLTCVFCFATIDVRIADLEQCVVRLSCDSRIHLFCNLDCFKRYVNYGHTTCPTCRTDIDPSILKKLEESCDRDGAAIHPALVQLSIAKGAERNNERKWWQSFLVCCRDS